MTPETPVTVIDNLLSPEHHAAVWAELNQGGWAYGAYSDPQGDRYFYKHFAGFVRDGAEPLSADDVEAQLANASPLIAQLWIALRTGPLAGNRLARCYANSLPPGTEGALHRDSDVPGHLTAIYYPHPAWKPNLAGETLIFNESEADIVAAIYPRPNRLAVFAGMLPHVARPISKQAGHPRITLMFKMMQA